MKISPCGSHARSYSVDVNSSMYLILLPYHALVLGPKKHFQNMSLFLTHAIPTLSNSILYINNFC